MKQRSFTELLYTVFRKDIGRKAMALFLAMLLWIYLDQKVVIRELHSLDVRVVQGMDEYYEESKGGTDLFFIVLPDRIMLKDNHWAAAALPASEMIEPLMEPIPPR